MTTNQVGGFRRKVTGFMAAIVMLGAYVVGALAVTGLMMTTTTTTAEARHRRRRRRYRHRGWEGDCHFFPISAWGWC